MKDVIMPFDDLGKYRAYVWNKETGQNVESIS